MIQCWKIAGGWLLLGFLLIFCQPVWATSTLEYVQVVSTSGSPQLALGFSTKPHTEMLQSSGSHQIKVSLRNTVASKNLELPKDGAGFTSLTLKQESSGLLLVLGTSPKTQGQSLWACRTSTSCVLWLRLKHEPETVPSYLPESNRPIVVVIDAGHGGRDSGARGPSGLKEKTITIGIAKDLERLMGKLAGYKVILTRSDDIYLPLAERVQIARKDKADLFVSIHANSCPDECQATGASVWVLDTSGRTSEAAQWLSKSENAEPLLGGVPLASQPPVLASVLLNLAQTATTAESHEVGSDILTALGQSGTIYKDTVQGANFAVLRSPDIPSVLVEVAFISNREEDKKLAEPAVQEELAEEVASGITNYFKVHPPMGTWLHSHSSLEIMP